MTIKTKLIKITETLTEKEGTYNIKKDEKDMAEQDRIDCDIKRMIEKYGIMPYEFLNKVKEPLYLNNLGESMTLTEKIKQREQIDNYFETMPAGIRKDFNDSKELFYNSILTGEFDKLIENGIFEQKQAEQYNNQLNAQSNKLKELEKQITIERGKYEKLQQQMATLEEKNNNVSTVQPTDNPKS